MVGLCATKAAVQSSLYVCFTLTYGVKKHVCI